MRANWMRSGSMSSSWTRAGLLARSGVPCASPQRRAPPFVCGASMKSWVQRCGGMVSIPSGATGGVRPRACCLQHGACQQAVAGLQAAGALSSAATAALEWNGAAKLRLAEAGLSHEGPGQRGATTRPRVLDTRGSPALPRGRDAGHGGRAARGGDAAGRAPAARRGGLTAGFASSSESVAGSFPLQPLKMGIHALEGPAMAVPPCTDDADEHRVVRHAEDSTSTVAFVVPRRFTSVLILGCGGEPGAS